jgi:hypothetical protein
MQHVSLKLEHVVWSEALRLSKRGAEGVGELHLGPSRYRLARRLERRMKAAASGICAFDDEQELLAAVEDRGKRALNAGEQEVGWNGHAFADDHDQDHRAPRCHRCSS